MLMMRNVFLLLVLLPQAAHHPVQEVQPAHLLVPADHQLVQQEEIHLVTVAQQDQYHNVEAEQHNAQLEKEH